MAGILDELKKRRYVYELILSDTMTREDYDSCIYCPTLLFNFYTVRSSYLGFQHLSRLSNYRIGTKDTLNKLIESYYNGIEGLPLWLEFIKTDLKHNVDYWKHTMPWFYKRSSRPEEMIDYHLNNFEYKNMVFIQRNFVYRNYVPKIKRLKNQAQRILKLIDKKLEEDNII